MTSQQRPLALITGASSGIGYELAKVFARNGYDLVLTARNREQLQRVADEVRAFGIDAEVLPADLADPAAPQAIFDHLHQPSRPLDVLVNNAGFGTFGPFAQSDPVSQMQMIQVNIAALTHLTRLFLPSMLAARQGHILNIASMAAFAPGPFLAVYYATKAYVVSFTEALAEELRHSGVRVTAVCPGPTKTDFQRRAGADRSSLFRGHVMDAAAVAAIAFKGFRRRQILVIPGGRNKFLSLAAKFAPRKLVRRATRKRNENR